MNKIPIVLASDENYSSQMYITILSALENKKDTSFYDIYCLIPKCFSSKIELEYFALEKKYNNCKINFICMGDAFNDAKMQITHITKPTYYRLMLPQLIKQYDKVIYLDVDVIVLQDLREFYSIEIKDYYIAGVKALSYVNSSQSEKDYYKSIGLLDISQYINAGVTLWNLDKIRKDNLQLKLLELALNNYSSMDQDVINVAFYNEIKHLDLKYNLMTKYQDEFLNRNDVTDIVYGNNKIIEAINNPVIIHYANDLKPWSENSQGWLIDYWYEYEKKSLLKCKKTKDLLSIYYEFMQEYKSKKIIFWGASLFLQELIEKKNLEGFNIIGVVDKNEEKRGEKIGRYLIYSPNDLKNLDADVVLFSIKHHSQKIYESVKDYLIVNRINIELAPNIF